MSVGHDYASRLDRLAKGIEALGPDRRDPARFLEDKDSLVKDARDLARAVEIDQVFGPRASTVPAPARLDLSPRTIVDRKGRAVRVEPRGRHRRTA